ncbi:MAG: hypothetical protein ACD_24C00465G0003, partial [uncultured bacterium]
TKIYEYAKWDIKYGIWWHPAQGFMSHNIKALSVFARYILAILLLFLGLTGFISPAFILIYLALYLIWSYRKIYLEFGDWKVSLWGPPLQITSDIGVMSGFLAGLFK